MKRVEALIFVALCWMAIVQTNGQGPLGSLVGGPIRRGNKKEDAGLTKEYGTVLGKYDTNKLRQTRDKLSKSLFSLGTEGLYLASDKVPSCFKPFDAEGCDENGESEEDSKTWMLLYTKKNRLVPEILNQCGGRLPSNTNFNPKHKTEIFIHGWLDGMCRTEWMREMKNALFERGDFNVILVGWSWGNGPEYDTAVKNVYVASKHIAAMLKNIMKQTGVGPSNFHLIGHSMGAHIGGLVGQDIPNLRRITGLDPALRPFYERPNSKKLDAGDAKIVDIIHSNGGIEGGVTIGDIYPIGDADFYPNGGEEQKNCKKAAAKSILKLDLLYGIPSLIYPEICSHVQSIQYYISSINPTECQLIGHLCADYRTFNAGKCDSCGQNDASCAVMGMDYEIAPHRESDKRHYMKYYLNTTHFFPYCA